MSTSAVMPTQLSLNSDEVNSTSDTESESDNNIINVPEETHSDEEVGIQMLEAVSLIHNPNKGMLMKYSVDVIFILSYIRQKTST